MITAHLDFACQLCNQKQSWYIMPLKEKTLSGDKINSVNQYHLQCKKCGQDYVLKFNIKRINGSKNGKKK